MVMNKVFTHLLAGTSDLFMM